MEQIPRISFCHHCCKTITDEALCTLLGQQVTVIIDTDFSSQSSF